MKFSYKKFGPGIYRPVIPIEIEYLGATVHYEVLVDSGADCCIFDAQLADILNINLLSGKRSFVGGITGKDEAYYLHKVDIWVGGKKCTIEAGFLPNIGNFSYGVVGQRGFFDIFIVKFDLIKAEIELKPR